MVEHVQGGVQGGFERGGLVWRIESGSACRGTGEDGHVDVDGELDEGTIKPADEGGETLLGRVGGFRVDEIVEIEAFGDGGFDEGAIGLGECVDRVCGIHTEQDRYLCGSMQGIGSVLLGKYRKLRFGNRLCVVDGVVRFRARHPD